jgi:transcriptional regulator with XRE-family HTH domain
MQDDAMGGHLAARLRAEREVRRWSIDELAARSRVSRAMISKLERGESSPTAALLGRLSGAFNMTMSQLLRQVEQDAGTDGGRVMRAADQRRWRDPATGFVRRSLTPPGNEPLLELVWGELPGRAEVGDPAEAYRFLDDQQIVVLDGTLEFVQGDARYELHEGDCLRLGRPDDCCFRNPGPGICRYIVAVLRARPS